MKPHKLTLAILATLLISPQALSQVDEQTQSTKDKHIEKIEVKGSYLQGYNAHSASGASRLELPISDIPQSISVITNAQLEDFQLNDINAALDTATGVNVERIETDRTYYTARGFDITNFQVDGIGLPLTAGNNHADEDTAIYDRVEVIRGANGLMTGVGNPSATVNFIRKRPNNDNQFLVNATYGSEDNARLMLDGTVKLNDALATRVVAVKQDQDSYLDRYSRDSTVLYTFIEANISDDTSLSLSHSFNNSDANSPLWGALPLFYTNGNATDYDRSTSTSADWAHWDVTKHNTVAELTHIFNSDWRLRGTYSHKTTDEDTQLFYVYGTPDQETELGLFGYASEYKLDDKHDLYDLYVEGDFQLFGRDHQLVVGMNYAKMSYTDSSLYDFTTGNGFPAMPDLNSWDGNTPLPTFEDGLRGSDVTQKQKAAYFTGRFNVVDNLHVILGGRYNDWEADGVSYEIIQDVEDSQFIPYFGAVYQVMPSVNVYASYTETFLAQNELDINNKMLNPVTGESKEIGIKSELFQGQLLASIAYFDVHQTNLATPDPLTADLPPTDQRYIGSDGISSHGFELDLAGEIYTGLNASIGYTNFSINGDELVENYTPSQLFKFAASYDVASITGLSVGVNMRWQDAISRNQGVVAEGFENAGEEIITKQDAYTIVDLMATYDINDKVSVSVNAFNVTDEKYLTSLYWSQSFYGAPASYSATLRWQF